MHRLSPLETGFLFAETRETPMHVGGLYLFTLPDGVDETAFLAGLLEIQRSPTEWRRPFAHKLKMQPLGAIAHWVEDEHFDVDYHVRHSALPKPGRYRELFGLAARLHQTRLDRHRPLWETHLIEGLANRQFALYSKVHHAAIDGVAGSRLAQSMFTTDPSETVRYSPFSMDAHRAMRANKDAQHGDVGSSPPTEGDVRRVAELLREHLGVSTNLFSSLKTYVQAWLKPGEHSLTTAWAMTPVTSFSSKITGARRFVAQSYSLPRVKAVGKALGGVSARAV